MYCQTLSENVLAVPDWWANNCNVTDSTGNDSGDGERPSYDEKDEEYVSHGRQETSLWEPHTHAVTAASILKNSQCSFEVSWENQWWAFTYDP